MNTSNSLVHKATKTVGNETIYVTISLNDGCRNGHQDFSITGDVYRAGMPKLDAYHLRGGCIHEEIARHFPEFVPFIRLHLCDWLGNPMYAVANGFYHLTEGFNNVKPHHEGFKAMFIEYYRLKPEQFDVLQTARNKVQYALKLLELGVLQRWKADADTAIRYLERLTGTKFVVDSKRNQLDFPTPEQIQEEHERQQNGYYTPEAEAQRQAEAQAKLLSDLAAKRDKLIAAANLEYEVQRQVLLVGGKAALDNMIYYTHDKSIAFNWRGYDKLDEETIAAIILKLTLPDGVTIRPLK